MGEIATMERRDVAPIDAVQKRIGQMGAQLKSVLPSHIDTAKFQRVAMTAIHADPDLLNADRQSLYTALTKAATDGLLPDKREGALTIANTKVKIDGRDQYIKMVVWMPMVAGIVKKVRQSGEVASMTAKAVYEKDDFDILFGDDDRIYHKPYMAGHPGKMVGAYSIVRLKDGTVSRDFLPMWRIDKAKGAAKTKYVWEAWPDEMAIKTVIRHHAKLLPQSTDIEAAFERDDTQQFDIAAAMLAGPQDAPAGPITAAALLEQADDAPAPIVHDLATGEIAADEVPELAPEADDPRLDTLYRIKAALNAATSTAALESISAENLAHYEAMTAEQQAEITEAYQGRWAELEA